VLAALLVLASCSGGGDPAAEPGAAPSTVAPTSTAYHGPHTTAATIEGPVQGGKGRAWRAEPDLPASGFAEDEYFASGTTTNGPYKIRMLVRRPADAAKFNGTVVTEWMNVTAGFEFDVDWGLFKDEILRSGYAYVGVGVQAVGINNKAAGNRFGPYPGLKEFDPVRYESLNHPGDAGAPEIFSQVGHAVRADPKLLGGLPVAREIATGQSQSAVALANYVTNVHKDALVYDGFFLHSGFGDATNTTRTPVLRFNSELEASAVWPAMRATHPDTDTFRYWETAGTGHTPVTSLKGAGDTLTREGLQNGLKCDYPTPDVPTVEYAGHAALDALDRWLRTGTPPPSKPLMELNGPPPPPPAAGGRMSLSVDPNTIARDADGNAKGGIRLPHIEAALGRHLATNSPASDPNCLLTPGYDAFDGQAAGTTPGDTWNEPPLAQRYATHQDYVDKVKAAAERARAAGVLLAPDAEKLVADAEAAKVP
jgi:hypothetical protein